MRLATVWESLSILGSFWTGLTEPKACLTHATDWPATAYAVAAARPAVSAEVTAFVAVNVVPMDTERVLANQTVLVENGRITVLGPSEKIQVPGAVRIDGRGKYLLPGLGTMHGHEIYFERGVAFSDRSDIKRVPSKDLAFYTLANGVTAVGSQVGGGSRKTVATLRELLSTAPSPRMYLGQRGRGRASGVSAAAYVAEAKAAGYDHIVAGGEDAALLKAARQAGLPVTMHDHTPPFDTLLALGLARGAAEHVYAIYWDVPRGVADYAVYWDGLDRAPTTAARDSAAALRRAMQARAAAIVRAGVWIAPTLACVTAPRRTSVALALGVTKVLQEAGARLLLATDDGWDVHDELRAFGRAGLSPYETLVAGTRNIAEYFGRLDSVGTVAVGKRADLVLVNGNPLTDLRHMEEPAGVMIDGRWFNRTVLDQTASLPSWLDWVLRYRGGALGGEAGQTHRETLQALWDTLAAAQPQGGAAHRQVLERFAAELGALRAVLSAEHQRERLDPPVRLWLREQARRGYGVTVAGVTATDPAS